MCSSGSSTQTMAQGKDTVILHGIGRSQHVPSMSPFVLKLETYLRMSKIPYEQVHDFKQSSQGKVPCIDYKGRTIGDSQFIIEFLNADRGVDLSSHLTPAEKGIARSFRKMLEENTVWVLALQRFVYFRKEQDKVLADLISNGFVRKVLVPRFIKKNAHGHGIGRQSQEDVLNIYDQDLKALSDFLGDKKFLMGEKPCEADATVFGLLAEFVYTSAVSVRKVATEKYPNLTRYCETMKAAFWPDWNECITHGGTRKATK